jgi:hypothetical protein
MPDVSRLSNRELDELAQRTDAAKGVVALASCTSFWAATLCILQSMPKSLIRCGLPTHI